MTSLSDIKTGVRSHQWDDADTITGTVVSAVETQQTEPSTGEGKTWNDGKPRMQWVFTIQTGITGEDDDGLRVIYAKGGRYEAAEGKGEAMLPAIVAAYKKAGISELEGAILTVKRTGRGKKTSSAFSPPNLFSAKAEPGKTPVPGGTVDDDPFS